MKRIEMNFLPDVYVTCDVCRGERYNRETLSVKYKGLSIADLLDTTIEDALPILENIPSIKKNCKLCSMSDSATSKSDNPRRRFRAAKRSASNSPKNYQNARPAKRFTFWTNRRPDLHFADVHKLLDVLQRLVDTGNTVIVIEHNLDVIKSADYVIDLGPEGGEDGGKVVATGTPEEVAKVKKSYTGQALKTVLN